jgi:hypothetical protein
MKSKKLVWAFGLLAIIAGISSAVFVSHKKTSSSTTASIDDCKEEPVRLIGTEAGTEIRLTKVSCGIEKPYFEMSAHSKEYNKEQSAENALQISDEDTCEGFEKSLYTQHDIIIGCCPLPAPAGSGEEREMVFVTKVNLESGAFEKQDDLNFANVVGRTDKKSGKFVETASCLNQKLVVDYAKLTKR